MPKFIQKPPIVEAVQWDGSVDNVEEISSFLHQHGFRSGLTVRVDVEGCAVSARIEFNQHFERPMRPQDWMVFLNGNMSIEYDDIFRRDYVDIEDRLKEGIIPKSELDAFARTHTIVSGDDGRPYLIRRPDDTKSYPVADEDGNFTSGFKRRLADVIREEIRNFGLLPNDYAQRERLPVLQEDPDRVGTPRDIFEQHFGRRITDDDWQWLKEFTRDNWVPAENDHRGEADASG